MEFKDGDIVIITDIPYKDFVGCVGGAETARGLLYQTGVVSYDDGLTVDIDFRDGNEWTVSKNCVKLIYRKRV